VGFQPLLKIPSVHAINAVLPSSNRACFAVLVRPIYDLVQLFMKKFTNFLYPFEIPRKFWREGPGKAALLCGCTPRFDFGFSCMPDIANSKHWEVVFNSKPD